MYKLGPLFEGAVTAFIFYAVTGGVVKVSLTNFQCCILKSWTEFPNNSLRQIALNLLQFATSLKEGGKFVISRQIQLHIFRMLQRGPPLR